jgi:hypothetical protein
MKLKIITYIFLLSFIPQLLYAGDDKKWLVRMYTGPVISSYHNNEDFTANTKARFAYSAGARTEHLFNGYGSIAGGLEYLYHSLAFNSYYFAPGETTIYDKSFAYSHTARLHELHVPILLKYNFTKENDKPVNAYVLAGWSYRFIFASYGYIDNTSSGIHAWEGKLHVTEEYHLLDKRGGSMMVAGFGFERNIQNKHRSIYGELQYKYGLSRFRYTGSGTAAPFFIKDSFVCVNLGYKI